MNLTTVLVTLVIAGSATPGITKLALQPVIAQKRATNFGVAETQAVTFAAKNEGQMSLTKVPNDCKLEDIGDNAYKITCWEGKSKYRMSATRAFRQWELGTGTTASGDNLFPTVVGTTATDGKRGAGSTSASANEASDNENYTTNGSQSYGGETSHNENYTTNGSQSYGVETSHNENYTTNGSQSYGGETPHNENHTVNRGQSHENKLSYNEKYTTKKYYSSRERR